MPTYRVSFTIWHDYSDGVIDVEAPSPGEAVQQVWKTEPAQLIPFTCNESWDVDAWVDEGEQSSATG